MLKTLTSSDLRSLGVQSLTLRNRILLATGRVDEVMKETQSAADVTLVAISLDGHIRGCTCALKVIQLSLHTTQDIHTTSALANRSKLTVCLIPRHRWNHRCDPVDS